LLSADPGQRESLLGSADPEELTAALLELGHTREAAAAEVLALADNVLADRGLRKTARRELHRLRSIGVEPPTTERLAAASTQASKQHIIPVSEAWASDSDPTGARALWLVGDRPLGGIWFAVAVLNDSRGLQDVNLVDTTRKRYQRDFEQARRGEGTWVSLPGAYALALVREALDLNREVGAGLPTRYHSFRAVFGEAPGPPERALVYETISPVEVNFNPGWLDDSPRLLGEPELRGWFVPVPSELRTRALEVTRAPSAGLLVPGIHPISRRSNCWLRLLASRSQLR